MSRCIPVSVVIPVRNEERNLAACLERLGSFAELIVVDSSSDDATVDIARRYGATVVQFQWDGRYPKKRNWTLLNYRFKTKWVLFLDADEHVTPGVCDAIHAAVLSDRHNGFWLRYSNYFQGKRLRFGLPQRKLALLRIGCGLYEHIEEEQWSPLDMEIHEHPVVEGSVGRITAEIEHRDDRGIARFLTRHVSYASWEARRLAALPAPDQPGWRRLTSRQRFKYKHLARWWYPWFYFVYAYVVRLGVLDGRAGFAYAAYKSWYFFTIGAMIRESDSNVTNRVEGSARKARAVAPGTLV